MISATTDGRPNSRMHDINSPKTQSNATLDRQLHSRAQRTQRRRGFTKRPV
jgi:hypothetical protein